MADREERTGTEGLLVGEGARSREVGAVLAALSALAIEGVKGARALVPAVLGDLEELLRERPGEGLLILESSRVPPEDIGFVRRFLERQPHWSLVLLLDGAQDARARDLGGLARTRAIVWPPDLETLRGLLRGAPAPAPRERRAANGARNEAAPAPAGSVELGAVLEEVLAAVALRGDGAPRFQFRHDVPVLTERAREPLVEALSGLLDLARRCAGTEGLVRAAVVGGARGPRVGIEFPLGPLPAKDLPGFLEAPWLEDGDPGLGEGVTAAAGGAARLRELGAEVEFSVSDGRVRCEVRLEPTRSAPARPAAGGARAGKPDDPFA